VALRINTSANGLLERPQLVTYRIVKILLCVTVVSDIHVFDWSTRGIFHLRINTINSIIFSVINI
jgi:hypothetical protein